MSKNSREATLKQKKRHAFQITFSIADKIHVKFVDKIWKYLKYKHFYISSDFKQQNFMQQIFIFYLKYFSDFNFATQKFKVKKLT